MSQQITLEQLHSAKKSVYARLRGIDNIRPSNWQGSKGRGIGAIEAFSYDLDEMERTLRKIQDRLENAKITIEV